MLTYSFNYSV